jgi:hypothetical protein
MANFNININANVVETNNIAGETLTAGDLVYLANDSKYYRASALLKSKSSTELKIALSNAVVDGSLSLLVYGYYEVATPFLTSGTKYYVSTANGEITSQLYIGTNNIIRYVGTALNTQTILFNPDQTFISENGKKINDVPLNFEHVHLEEDIANLDKYTVAEVDALIASATDISYTHTQGAASASWVIAHSLGKNPSVTIQDGSGNNIFGQIVYTNVNNLTINFNTAFAGVAYLN